jgi:hypothetical protein
MDMYWYLKNAILVYLRGTKKEPRFDGIGFDYVVGKNARFGVPAGNYL